VKEITDSIGKNKEKRRIDSLTWNELINFIVSDRVPYVYQHQ